MKFGSKHALGSLHLKALGLWTRGVRGPSWQDESAVPRERVGGAAHVRATAWQVATARGHQP